MSGKKCICIVLDSVGIGALPDAASFGDEGSHTLLHVMQSGFPLPNLCAMGLANIGMRTARQGIGAERLLRQGGGAFPRKGYHRRALGDCRACVGQAVSYVPERVP